MRMMEIEIKKIATVQMGYSFRLRLETESGGTMAVIQMKDLLHDNTVGCNNLTKVNMKSVKEHHLVRNGDLVFRSRGHVTTSAILLDNLDKAVVAAPLLRIRITNPNKILPEYLNWYISQRDAQCFLKSRQEGTHGGMISRKQLEEMRVDIPSIQIQKKIVEVASLSTREQTILNMMAEKREKYISKLLMKFAKGE